VRIGSPTDMKVAFFFCLAMAAIAVWVIVYALWSVA
jgi:hypothetical protein